jgi:hypothetical protein
MPAEDGPYEQLPPVAQRFALAQHGLVAVWRHTIASHPDQVLWIPDFFCPPVVAAWERAGIAMRLYEDDPRWAEPRWASIQARSGDLVLAVNYFGLRRQEPWTEWSARNGDLRVIEDHSHDPWSDWARGSTANYAFASLRKTLPIPDGATVWSPRGSSLPEPAAELDWTGSALKLAAMIWKRDYLGGGPVVKETYRDFQAQGESALLNGADLAMAPWSRAALEAGIPTRWRDRRVRNVRAFLARTADDPRFQALGGSSVDQGCPFNAVLIFADPVQREGVRTRLVAHRVYAAVHWSQPASATGRVGDLAGRILTIPLDQRYTETDVDRIARILAAD